MYTQTNKFLELVQIILRLIVIVDDTELFTSAITEMHRYALYLSESLNNFPHPIISI